jgi:hypothetical protein
LSLSAGLEDALAEKQQREAPQPPPSQEQQESQDVQPKSNLLA